MDIANVNVDFTADTSDFIKSVDNASNAVKEFGGDAGGASREIVQSFNNASAASRKLLSTVSALAAIGGGALTAFGVQAFRAAARVEELDIAMRAVGKSSNSTYEELNAATKAIRANGIELAASQEIALKFAKNNLDLASASKIARVAQDLAVISQQNSTDTTNRLIHAVITQNSVVLRQAGIQKTAGEAYKEYAKEIGKTARALTAQEKQQAIINLILEEGTKVQGTYEASMRSAGKVLRSFPRIIDDIKIGLGTMLSKGFAPMILAAYQMVASFATLVKEGGALVPLVQGLTAVFVELANPIKMSMDAATRFIKTITLSKDSVDSIVQSVRKFLPMVASLGAGLAALGGQNILLKLIPGMTGFAKLLNPVLIGLTALVLTTPQLQVALKELLSAFTPLLPAVAAIGVALNGVFVALIPVVVAAIQGLAKVIQPVAEFIGRNAKTVAILAMAFLGLKVAIMAASAAKVIFLATSKLMGAAITKLIAVKNGLIKVLGFLRKAFLLLRTAMLANPIGAIILAFVALGAVLVLAWKKSEKFREVILKALGAIVKGAAEAFSWVPGLGPKLKKAADGFDEWAERVQAGYKKATTAADDFNRASGFFDAKDRRGADYFRPQADENKKKVITNDETDIGANLKELKDNLKKAVRSYNDFIKFDFAKEFIQGSDSARRAIIKGLDMLERIFEEKAKGLSGDALKKLEQSFNQIRKQVRSFIPQAEALAATFEELEKELSEAQKDLDRALEMRAESINKFNQLFREPFGEPSALKRSLSNAEATVDSIINMYDDLVDTITKRFEGIAPAQRDELINFLTAQTAALVELARKRATAVQVLQEAESDLRDILSEQKTFQTDLTSGLKNFATAIADLSKADSAATLRVIKTATGLVITQLQSSTSGVDKITKQLQDRLKTVRDFTNNIRTLLARGLNEQYVKQLLGAGPEAAGLTAAALAIAGADQITEVNNLYSEIDSMSQAFGKDMAVVFYQNAVDMATAFRDGAQAEVDSITAQMVAIREAIEQALTPLRDMAAKLGEDTMQALVDSIKKRKNEVLAEIQDLVNKIAELMAAAARGIGVNVTGTPGPVGGGGGGGGFVSPIGVPKSQIQAELDAASKKLKDMRDKLAKGGLGSGAKSNLLSNITTQEMMVKELKSELKSATAPAVAGKTSSLSSVTNVNSGAVQITVTNTAGGSIDAADIEQAVTDGMLTALDGRRMVAV